MHFGLGLSPWLSYERNAHFVDGSFRDGVRSSLALVVLGVPLCLSRLALLVEKADAASRAGMIGVSGHAVRGAEPRPAQ